MHAIQEGASRREPEVVILEDVHWIDRASEGLLAGLAARKAGVLAVLNYRSGYAPAAGVRWRELALAPLDYEGRLAECLACTAEASAHPPADPRIGSEIFGTNPFPLLLALRASALRDLGHFDEAEAVAEAAAASARRLEDAENLVVAAMMILQSRLYHGGPGSCLDVAREAVAAAERVGSTFSRSQAHVVLGAALAALGEWERAREAYQRALALLREARFGLPDEPWYMWLLAEARARCGERAPALRLADEAIELARARGARLALARALTARARIVALVGDVGRAAEALAGAREAAGLARRLGARTPEADALYAAALAARLAGDRASCAAGLAAALRAYRAIGADGRAAEVEAELAEPAGHGAPPPAPV